MKIGLKFLFISKFFILIFITINLTYIFPINVFDVSYYLNFSSIVVDAFTSTF